MAKLLFSVLLVALVACTSALPRPSKVVANRIVGGQNVTVGEYEFPSQISLRYVNAVNGRQLCGGSIINPNFVVTAAHCIAGASEISVITGRNTSTNPESSSQIVNVSSVTIHEDYDPSTFENDIAIVKLQRPLTFSPIVGPAAIPLPPSANYPVTGDVTAIRGETTFDGSGSPVITLNALNVTALSDLACRLVYIGRYVADSMICANLPAGGKDSFQGDYGGALVSPEGYLVGIASWGLGCTLPGYPSVYTRVTSYLDWITANTT